MYNTATPPFRSAALLVLLYSVPACGGSSLDGSANDTGPTATGRDGGSGTGGSRSSSGTDASLTGDVTDSDTRLFRITELELRDPHLFLGATDITDEPLFGVSVNGSLLRNGFSMDYDGDGLLDVSILAQLPASDGDLDGAELHIVGGRCPLASPNDCAIDPESKLDARWVLAERAEGTCLEPLADSTGSYSPPITLPAGRCIVGEEGHPLYANLGGIWIEMSAVRISARLQGVAPVQRLVDGLIMGFVSDEAARAAQLPEYLPLVAGSPITEFLRAEDRDAEQAGEEPTGWWLYLNFVADPANESVQ